MKDPLSLFCILQFMQMYYLCKLLFYTDLQISFYMPNIVCTILALIKFTKRLAIIKLTRHLNRKLYGVL